MRSGVTLTPRAFPLNAQPVYSTIIDAPTNCERYVEKIATPKGVSTMPDTDDDDDDG